MPAAWVTSRAVAAGAYKTGDMSFKSDKTHRHLFWWMCGQLMQLAQMETSDSSSGGGVRATYHHPNHALWSPSVKLGRRREKEERGATGTLAPTLILTLTLTLPLAL